MRILVLRNGRVFPNRGARKKTADGNECPFPNSSARQILQFQHRSHAKPISSRRKRKHVNSSEQQRKRRRPTVHSSRADRSTKHPCLQAYLRLVPWPPPKRGVRYDLEGLSAIDSLSESGCAPIKSRAIGFINSCRPRQSNIYRGAASRVFSSFLRLSRWGRVVRVVGHHLARRGKNTRRGEGYHCVMQDLLAECGKGGDVGYPMQRCCCCCRWREERGWGICGHEVLGRGGAILPAWSWVQGLRGSFCIGK